MSLTPDSIVDTVCQTLKLDREILTAPYKARATKDYSDAKLICAYVMRRKLIEIKSIMGSFGGERARVEAEKPITYERIAYTMKRKNPQTIMANELRCNDLLQTDKQFKAKYEMVVNLLDSNINSTL